MCVEKELPPISLIGRRSPQIGLSAGAWSWLEGRSALEFFGIDCSKLHRGP